MNYDDDLNREIRDHLDLEAEERVARGERLEEAQFAARRRFGNVGLVKEAIRATRWSARFDALQQDLRYALRGLRRSPAFTATAIVSLTLGIGANTAVFSLINALLLRTLPVADPERLVQVSVTGADQPRENFSYIAIRGLSTPDNGLTGLCGFSQGESFAIGDIGSDRRVSGTWMTGDCHRVLGVRFSIGRGFTPQDDRPEGGANGVVAVISDGYWDREYRRSPDAIGKTIILDGKPATIIGVTAPGFTGPNVGRAVDITVPITAMPLIRPDGPPIYRRGINWLRLWGRLSPDVTQQQAQTRLSVTWSRIIDEVYEPRDREAMRDSRVGLTAGGTGWSDLRRRFARPLVVLTVIVGLVLVIACANLASLLLARATARRREFAVRLAMGAGRARLMRQVFTESLLLAVFGAAAGLAFAQVATRVLLTLLSTGRGRLIALDVQPDLRVLTFTLAAAVVTSMLFGLAPAFRATAVDESSALRDATRARGARRGRLASALVAAQAGLSLVLVVGAALFVRTLNNLVHVDTGFRRDSVTLVGVEIPRSVRANVPQAALAQEIVDDLRALPGVAGAAVSGSTPMTGSGWTLTVGVESNLGAGSPESIIVTASPTYFDVYGIALRAGRVFARSDGEGAPPVAVVNDAFARERFGDTSPIGQRIRVGGRGLTFEIVGVVASVSMRGMRAAPLPAVYLSFFQAPNPQLSGGGTIALLGERGSPLADAIRERIRARLPVAGLDIRPFRELVDSSLVNERLMAMLAAFFGAMAVALASIGLYGLLAFNVSHRTSEIGVRTALGASRASVAWLVMSDALRLAGAGVFIGIPVIWATTRFIAGMLFGVAPTDVVTIALSVAITLSTALFAAYLPARRAMQVNPIAALKYE